MGSLDEPDSPGIEESLAPEIITPLEKSPAQMCSRWNKMAPVKTNGKTRVVMEDVKNGNYGCVSMYTKKVTRELAEYTVNYFAQNSGAKPTSTHAETLKRTMDEVSTRHKLVFSNMAQKLEISKDNLEDVFINVVEEMFTDNQLNWGRIVTIYAFGGHIARYCKRSGMVDLLPRLIQVLSEYTTRRLGPWIDHEGGWVSLFW